jgi:hypothetical protein
MNVIDRFPSFALVLLSCCVAQPALIDRALSQQHGFLYNPSGQVMLTFRDDSLMYEEGFGGEYTETGKPCTGFRVVPSKGMKLLIDLQNPRLVFNRLKKMRDGSFVLYDGRLRMECRLDTAGYIWNLPGKTKAGRIKDGVLGIHMTDTYYETLRYENIPAEYLFAIFFPQEYSCSASKKE